MSTIADLNAKIDALTPLIVALAANQQPTGQQAAIDQVAAKLDLAIAAATPAPTPAA